MIRCSVIASFGSGANGGAYLSSCFNHCKLLLPSSSFVCKSFSSSSSSSSPSPSSSAGSKRSIRLALLGAPGVGKGTFAARIGPHYGIPCISTGDLVRAEIKAQTPIGQQIADINKKGGLVEDGIILDLLKRRLAQKDCLSGFLLDGFPRRVTQAQALSNLARIDFVVNISLAEEVLIEKTINRRVCKSCGHGYNFADIRRGEICMPPLLPKKPNVCDKCGSSPLALIQREDDTEQVVRNRLEIYRTHTAPLIAFYQQRKQLLDFNVKRGIEDWGDFKALLDQEANRRGS